MFIHAVCLKYINLDTSLLDPRILLLDFKAYKKPYDLLTLTVNKSILV